MSMKRTAVVSALWAAGESWSLRGVSLIVFLILARLVDPAAFGLVALAAVYVTTVQALSDQGLAIALIQREHLEEAHKDSAFWANVAVGALLALATLAIAEPAASFYKEPRLASILRWYALWPLLGSLSVVQQALLRRALRFRELALRQLAGAIAGGVAGVGLAFAGMGVWALVAQQLVNQAVALVVLWSVAQWRPRFAFSWIHFRHLFGFGFNVLAANVVRAIGFQADRLVLGYFLGTTELGYYSVAQRLLAIVTDFVAGSAERIVVPLFARIQGDRERVNRGLMTAQRVLTLTTMPAFIGLAVSAPVLMPVVLGSQWQASILPAQILAFASLGFCLSFFFGHVLTALGRPGLRLGIVLAQALGQVAFSVIGVQFGLAGLCLGVVANQVLFYLVELLFLQRNAGFSLTTYLGEGLLPLAASLLMAAAVVLLGRSLAGERPVAQLAAEIALGAVVYAILLLIFARQRLKEPLEMARGLRRRQPQTEEGG
jgi:O-antigen/teichoic acid export membrane protein